MKILNEKPPHYDQVIAAFPEVANEPHAIFTYGECVFNPGGGEIPFYTLAHEQVHIDQQKGVGGPEWWWETYLWNKEFRFSEELEAYRVEYRSFCKVYKDRNERNGFLNYIAKNLSGPLYGNCVTRQEAISKIKGKV